jgi:hypothetical protein
LRRFNPDLPAEVDYIDADAGIRLREGGYARIHQTHDPYVWIADIRDTFFAHDASHTVEINYDAEIRGDLAPVHEIFVAQYPRDDEDSEYDEDGFDRDGYNRDGYNRDGFDRHGYDEEGYDEGSYDRDGYDSEGYDRDGYDSDGYDSDGYDCDGYDCDGYDIDGNARPTISFHDEEAVAQRWNIQP